MEIDLAGAAIALDGETNAIVDAVLAALRANGGRIVEGAPTGAADILLVSCPLRPGTKAGDPRSLYA
ncbi:pteridine reductase, partial [Mesorhizobium sp. M2C.T.Ca.TU.002.02.1.1]